MADQARLHKERLRASILAARRRLSDDDRREAGQAIATHGLTAWGGLPTVAAYAAVGDEPPTAALLDGLAALDAQVLLPVIDGTALDWVAYDGAGAMTPGPLGISEPTGPRRGVAALLQADVVIVPALAADRHGHRLGRGRGYYDRSLRDVTAPIIAVLYDDELLDDVPAEPHDRRIDAVLRPAGLTSLSR